MRIYIINFDSVFMVKESELERAINSLENIGCVVEKLDNPEKVKFDSVTGYKVYKIKDMLLGKEGYIMEIE